MSDYIREIFVEVSGSERHGEDVIEKYLEPVLRRFLNDISIAVHEFYPDATIEFRSVIRGN